MNDLYLITGSTLGTAEDLAELIREDLPSEQFNLIQLNGSVPLSDLTEMQNLIVITSTKGAGEVPDNLEQLINNFASDSNSQSPILDYSKINYFVIAIGSKDYDLFCGSKEIVENALSKANKVSQGMMINISDFEYDYEKSALNFVEQNLHLFK